MAAGVLAEPGTEYGACAEPCEHTDCASTRSMAEAVCRFCTEPIGYGRRFYVDDPDMRSLPTALVHASCLEDAES